jgi:hypothetical protein
MKPKTSRYCGATHQCIPKPLIIIAVQTNAALKLPLLWSYKAMQS